MKPVYVAFKDKRLEEAYVKLQKGKFEDRRLHSSLQQVIVSLKKCPSSGIKIQKRLWPKVYKQFKISNLWKVDVIDGWRVIYTIKTDEVMILAVILEWFDHKAYNKRFKY